MKHFMVLNPVGPHTPGQVIAISPEDEKRGVLPKRLIDLGAIREATEEESADAVQYGTTDPDRYLNPIPYVEPKPEAVKSAGGSRNAKQTEREAKASGAEDKNAE